MSCPQCKPTVDLGNSFARDESRARSGRSAGRCAWVIFGFLLLVLGFAPRSAANVIYVTTLKDEIGGADGCSLKDAIYSANLHNNVSVGGYDPTTLVPSLISTQCVPGSGDDVIVLPPGAVLTLNVPAFDITNDVGPTATPVITSTVTIEAYGATLEYAPACSEGSGQVPCPDPSFLPYTFRLFAVGTTGSLTIINANIKGFVAQGGSGRDGGGGGMGAGGAIYIQGGKLEILDSTLNNTTAIGGNGGGHAEGVGGGGGGGVGAAGGSADDVDRSLGGQLFPPGGGGGGGGSSELEGSAGSGAYDTGGGGGGTLEGFSSLLGALSSQGGVACGGNGGDSGLDVPPLSGENGASASCNGGGGGGGSPSATTAGNGGNGTYGGGGGGGANGGGDGGNGGFGGGGGSGWSGFFGGTTGGNGGFGGGGGVGPNGSIGNGNAGSGGTFGGSASHTNGGGGAGLGGAIFNDSGDVTIENSTFTGNDSVGGRKGGDGTDTVAGTGEGHGGAIFSRNGSLTILNSTIDANGSSGTGGGVYFYQDSTKPTVAFVLRNTIIANSGGSDDAASAQCTMNAFVITGGDWRGNLIQNDDPSAPCDYTPSTGTVSTEDPLLGPLQNNGGYTPTMALGENSPAWNTADPTSSILSDQRGWIRPELGGFDIGAYELCSPDPTVTCARPQLCFNHESLTMQASPPAGGTTTPPPGTGFACEGSVIPILATPNPGYTFTGWSGNALLPNTASSYVVMAEPQSITANFALCNCVVNVSGYVTVTRGPYVLNLGTGQYFQTVTLTNNSAFTLIGPVSLVLDSLSANASLFNATGSLNVLGPPFSPYINVTAGNLAPGQMASITLQFTDPTRAAISYSTRVLAGPGSR